ncbi:MAG: glycerol kinase GlpK [Thermoplasmatota archaeon]
MARRLVLAIDEGTTGVTVLALDGARRVAGRAYREIPCSYPRPGWVEQDAAPLWQATLETAKAALRDAKARSADVAAIGIANQRETTVVWDRRTGKPVAPAIVWQDRRTASRCAELRPDWEDTVRGRTGLVLDPYFSATKLEWLLDRKGLRQRAGEGRLAFGTIDSWLAWNLTGRHVTDTTNASRTMLWDIHKGAWDEEILDLFGVPAAILPDVLPSAQVVGTTDALGTATPVAALVGDQQAALFGSGCLAPGQAKNTYGTGCFLLQHTGATAVASKHGLLTTRAASTGRTPQFALEGSVFTGGAAIQWLRDQLGIVATAPEVDALAGQVPDSGGVVVVPAFTGLGAPHWDPDARGAILGLSRGSDRRHIARALLDAIACQSADLVEAMQKDSRRPIPELRVDGGAAKSAPLLQAQADLLQRPVVRPANVETTAMGAGLLAGLATDMWKVRDLKGATEGEVKFSPRMKAKEAARRMDVWHAAVATARTFKP